MAHQRRYPRRVTPSPVVPIFVDFTLPCFSGDIQTTYFCDCGADGPPVEFTVTFSGWLIDHRRDYHNAMGLSGKVEITAG